MNAAVKGISTINDESKPIIQSIEIPIIRMLPEANSVKGSQKDFKIPASANPLTNTSKAATKNIILQFMP